MRNRNVQIIVRMNEKEAAHLRKQVKRTGLSMSAYIRFLCNGYAPKENPPVAFHDMMRALYQIGNNMNQIAARANATGFIDAAEYDRQHRELCNTIFYIEREMHLPAKLDFADCVKVVGGDAGNGNI